jgi:hypothetical protein
VCPGGQRRQELQDLGMEKTGSEAKARLEVGVESEWEQGC